MEEKAPDVVRFLEKYRTSSAMTSAALAYIEENNAFYMDAAKWFLKEYEDVWTAWLDEKEIKAVKATL
jgi:glycine betaine/proline transport system substrate-binding protein